MSYKVTSKKFLSLIMVFLIVLSMSVFQVGAISAEESQKQIQVAHSDTV